MMSFATSCSQTEAGTRLSQRLSAKPKRQAQLGCTRSRHHAVIYRNHSVSDLRCSEGVLLRVWKSTGVSLWPMDSACRECGQNVLGAWVWLRDVVKDIVRDVLQPGFGVKDVAGFQRYLIDRHFF